MNEEFGSVGGFMAENAHMVMLVEKLGVTISALSQRECQAWRDYVRTESMWTEVHVPSGFPVSSLFQGAYISLESHVLTETTRRRYEEMLEELASHGEVFTFRVAYRQW